MSDQARELQKTYALRFTENVEYRDAVWQVLITDYFQQRVGHDKVILDLGSGWGEFINNVQAAKKYAMDLNPDSKERVASEVEFLQQDCSHDWQVPVNSLDVVFTSNFFEHLPTKASLLKTLEQAHKCLKPGGKIICMGPNFRHVEGAYWDFFDHHLELTHLSLVEGLRMSGFQLETVISRFLPYTMADGKRPPLAAIKLYLRLPLAWRFFGKQFLVTGRKSASGEV